VKNVVFAFAKLSVFFFLASPLADFVSSNTINLVASCTLYELLVVSFVFTLF
jgi:hypothetical protein